MADHLARVLARFEARVHNTKNGLVAIPVDVQRHLRLVPQGDNHLLLYSIRRAGEGRWSHHWCELTSDNEFSVPADVCGIDRGTVVEVKTHRVVRNVDALADESPQRASGAALLLQLAGAGDDSTVASSRHVDDALYDSDA